jgi:hypothetical protein
MMDAVNDIALTQWLRLPPVFIVLGSFGHGNP